jgi:RimJ/RimL family protein N-acetyltransferase
MPAERLPDHLDATRLTVRRWTVDDVDRMAVAVHESLDHLRPWMPWVALEPLPRAERVELVEGWTAGWEAGSDLFAGFFVGDLAIGSGGLHHRLGPDALEIGYWVHPDHVGRGYATEAAAALATLAFRAPGIERVEIHHDTNNEASAAVPRRLGFTWLGAFVDEVLAPAECGVEGRWAMSRADWAASTASTASTASRRGHARRRPVAPPSAGRRT